MRKESLIKLYILDKENYTRYIPKIRAFTKEPISEIKSKIQKEEAVIVCAHTKKPKEFKQLYHLMNELIQMDAKIKIMQDMFGEWIREVDMHIVENLIKTSDEIDGEIQEIIDLEIEMREKAERNNK